MGKNIRTCALIIGSFIVPIYQVWSSPDFKQGYALYAQGNYKEALTYLINTPDKNDATAFIIGRCYEEEKDVASAWQWYREAIKHGHCVYYKEVLLSLQRMGIHTQQMVFENVSCALIAKTSLVGMQILFLCVLLYTIGMVLGIMRRRRLLLFVCAIILVVASVCLYNIYALTQKIVVLTLQKKELYYGPGEQFCVQATLEKHTECVIHKQKDSWVKINVGSLTGWIKNTDLAFGLNNKK